MCTDTGITAPTAGQGRAPGRRRGEPVISVRGIGKRYDIYDRNIHRFADLLTGSRRRSRPFWALQEIRFDVHAGDAVGVIGRNGSGKSTLMQIIAGTLAPTTGEVHVRGRVAALLELGSGFNPQFTGRENVFLAGSILGFSRKDMEERFDTIAAFADIGEFLDQPIEVYSSGMHARLAFSVAISVEPDILILDEILSVGDAGFQFKCVARLRQLLDKGVTLLFVSHSPDAVKSICNKGLFLKRGHQEFFGSSVEAVDRYMQFIREATTQRGLAAQPALAEAKPAGQGAAAPAPRSADDSEGAAAGRYGTGHGVFSGVRLLNDAGEDAEVFAFGERVTVEAAFRAAVDLDRLDVTLMVRDRAGIDVFGTTAWDEGARLASLVSGEELVCRFRFINGLRPGPHAICLTLSRRPNARGEGWITLDNLDACATFEALAPDRREVRGKVTLPVEVEYVPVPVPRGGDCPPLGRATTLPPV